MEEFGSFVSFSVFGTLWNIWFTTGNSFGKEWEIWIKRKYIYDCLELEMSDWLVGKMCFRRPYNMLILEHQCYKPIFLIFTL